LKTSNALPEHGKKWETLSCRHKSAGRGKADPDADADAPSCVAELRSSGKWRSGVGGQKSCIFCLQSAEK